MDPRVEPGQRARPRRRLAEGGASAVQAVVPLVIHVRGQSEATGEGKKRPLWREPLQQFAQALVRAASFDDVAAAVVTYGTAAAGARCGHVVLLDHENRVAVSLLGGQAVPSRRLDDVGVETGSPWSDVIRGTGPLTFASAGKLYSAYPDLSSVLELPTTGAVVTLALASGGQACGAVTFGFGRSGRVSPSSEAALAEIAALAGSACRRAALYESEHHSAEMLQRAYLPARLSDVAGLSFASRYLPAGESLAVGGDWYDVIALPGTKVGMVIGDVAGHGIQAAAVMASLRAALRAFATIELSPAEILTRLNTYTCLYKPDAFATVLVAVYDAVDGRLRYASAGHPPAVVVFADGATNALAEPLGPPLGVPDTRYAQGEQPFPPGSALVTYTDGLVERKRRAIDETVADLVRAASGGAGVSPEELCDLLVSDLLSGVELFDDAALLVARRHPAGSPSPPP